MSRSAIATESAPSAIGPYSQAISATAGASGMLFVSGQIPLDPATGKMVEGGIGPQTDRVLQNLGAILSAGGCTWADVVKTTIFLVDLADFATVNEIYGRVLSTPFPARATVQVAALPRGALVEIDAIAVRG
jgi:2-iminobutanoate/2-iminopropanoate deaminase